MKRKNIVHISLTKKGSLNNAIEFLENYTNSINYKTQLFIDKLLDDGISVGQANCGVYGDHIAFRKDFRYSEDGIDGIIIAMNTSMVRREWIRNDVIVSAEVNPILMAEFGSGWLANVMQSDGYRGNELNVGQGTFPGGTHAFDPEGWYWVDTNGDKHHSIGERPTYPMYKASMAIIMQISKRAKEVFEDG